MFIINLILQKFFKKNLSHEKLKSLYIKKYLAIQNRDFIFLNKLRIEYPQLFDKQFLYEMLQKELHVTGKKLPEHINQQLLDAISNKK